MPSVPSVSPSELEVLRVLWDAEGPVGSGEVVASLEEHLGWHPKTTRTLLARLVEKRAVGVNRRTARYRYRALVSEEVVARRTADALADGLASLHSKAMVMRFVERVDLDADELLELAQLLEERAQERRSERK